jgi:hypothetical protein
MRMGGLLDDVTVRWMCVSLVACVLLVGGCSTAQPAGGGNATASETGSEVERGDAGAYQERLLSVIAEHWEVPDEMSDEELEDAAVRRPS